MPATIGDGCHYEEFNVLFALLGGWQQSSYPLLFRSIRNNCDTRIIATSFCKLTVSMSTIMLSRGLSVSCGPLRARAGSSLPCCSLLTPSHDKRHVQLARSSLTVQPLGLRQPPQSCNTAPRQQQQQLQQQQQPRQQVRASALPFVNAAAQAIPQWDLLCGVAAAVCSIAWVKIFDRLKRAGVLEQVWQRALASMPCMHACRMVSFNLLFKNVD